MHALIGNIVTPDDDGVNPSTFTNLRRPHELWKKLTRGHVVITGRNTYNLLQIPTNDRLVIVLSKTQQPRKIDEEDGSFHITSSIDEAMFIASKEKPRCHIFFIGGEELIRSARPYLTDAYITEIGKNCHVIRDVEKTGQSYPLLIAPNKWMVAETTRLKETHPEVGQITIESVHFRKVSERLLQD